MSASNICHFLIGVPGSGKSTFAAALFKLGNYVIVSTDEIRAALYGDAAIQGNWNEIENQALESIENAIASGKGVIYDATNFKRAFRMDFLMKAFMRRQKVEGGTINPTDFPTWIAWYLKTPIETCIEWNQKRDRQVSKEIIASMYKSLSNFPPLPGEGFAAVEEVDVTTLPTDIAIEAAQIEKRIKNLQRRIINRHNRTQHKGITFHNYSHLLDFDRLMHLISLIIKYPGIGNLHATNPSLLSNILGNVPVKTNDIQEITAIMASECGTIYANSQAIAKDLQWLIENGVVAIEAIQEKLEAEIPLLFPFSTHSYSDTEPFQRLIGTIRFILHHPFLANVGEGSLPTLAIALQQAGVIYGNSLDNLRKDIEKILRPYKILPEFAMRNGYFAGTGILSKQELIKVFEILQSQAQSLDDPLALEIYETFKQRMLQSKLINRGENVYPVRSIANSSIVDSRYLHSTALANNLSKLEQAIANGELLELNRFSGSAGYNDDPKSFFFAYPLQIVFSNLAWYLGFECVDGDEPGLFRFERLDRLFLGKPQLQNLARSRTEQEKSLQRLQALLKGSAGLFLGNSASEQRKFLSQDKQVRVKACMTVEVWFNNQIYNFVTEGTKRFAQIKMSPPVKRTKVNLPKSIFSLKQSSDREFPNRFQAILPKWSLDEFDLLRWIIGFGGNVKVVEPPELVEKVKGVGSGIIGVYDK
ncbi:MAG: WYL domain-containing protein [Tolypothrix sp. Co-bin9]|nr:WYL domain-containing protein [Tolypothrix sp. Co-bin9]